MARQFCADSACHLATGRAPRQQLVLLLLLAVVAAGVGSSSGAKIIVNPGNSIQRAVDRAKPGDVIHIRAGVYNQKVVVSTSYLTFLGDGPGSTVITHDQGIKVGQMLVATATVAVLEDRFWASGLTIRNGHVGSQALALALKADHSQWYNVELVGDQDTLMVGVGGAHYFEGCRIVGSTDVIFGGGRALFVHSKLVGKKSWAHDRVFFTASASGRRINGMRSASGFSFVDCQLTSDAPTWLGRAWGRDAWVVFIRPRMDADVAAEGWLPMANTDYRRSAFFAQVGCKGRGCYRDMSSWGGTKVLSRRQVVRFSSTNFVGGQTWIRKPKKFRYHWP